MFGRKVNIEKIVSETGQERRKGQGNIEEGDLRV